MLSASIPMKRVERGLMVSKLIDDRRHHYRRIE